MRRLLIGLVALLPAWGAADAQDSRDIRVRVGAGVQLRPEYVGADGTSVGPLFHVNFAKGTKPFAFAELAARVQALARRPPTGLSHDWTAHGARPCGGARRP